MPFWGDMLVPWRVYQSHGSIFFFWVWNVHMNVRFFITKRREQKRPGNHGSSWNQTASLITVARNLWVGRGGIWTSKNCKRQFFLTVKMAEWRQLSRFLKTFPSFTTCEVDWGWHMTTEKMNIENIGNKHPPSGQPTQQWNILLFNRKRHLLRVRFPLLS